MSQKSKLSKKKRKISFTYVDGYEHIQLPCGQCIGCRLEYSRQWAIRCTHEASMHLHNCFITLTYDEQHLPKNGTLIVKDYQDFMKRLRHSVKPKKIRFFHCGEYGEKNGRPHYHACIFNHDFEDKTLFRKINNVPLYISNTLTQLWGKGLVSIGAVTFESAAYVARYIMKKQNGTTIESKYENIDFKTGEVITLKKEYTTMSRRPGIAHDWYNTYKDDVYPHDYLVIRNGKKIKPPKYYDSLYELDNPEQHANVKENRKIEGIKNADNNTYDRLRVREKIKQSKINKLPRIL